MPVLKRFEPSDTLLYVLETSPEVRLTSGSLGWRGNVGTSGSVSMYGGLRSREVEYSVDGIKVTPVIDVPTYNEGKVRLSASYPMSASVRIVKAYDSDRSTVSETEWDESHFAVIKNLYDYYSRTDPEYTTASYHHYVVYSQPESLDNLCSFDEIIDYDFLSSSYTIEGRVKPFTVSGSDDYMIVGRPGVWELFISSSTGGKLAFSASDGSQVIHTSSLKLERNRWQHIAYRVDESSTSGTFTIDLVDAGQVSVTGNLDAGDIDAVRYPGVGDFANSPFHGLLGEMRLWSTYRTDPQLSSSFRSTLFESGSTDLVLYARFNDGPQEDSHQAFNGPGSGAFDYSHNGNHGALSRFDRPGPVWVPSDDRDFVTDKRHVTASIDFLRVIHVPSLYYGRQIATGSVHIVDNTFASGGLIRTFIDDGRGGLYISGSVGSSSLEERESYEGVKWNKVGNVFYSEGLIVLKDPSVWDVGEEDGTLQSPLREDMVQISFRGDTTVPTRTVMCRADAAEFNASNNPTYWTQESGSSVRNVVRDDPVTYITGIGIYDSKRELVAVAKLAHPVRKRERDRQVYRVRIDF